jgi:cell division protein FtsI (penicillin-binding protein 3)
VTEHARDRTRLVGLGLSALFVVLAGKGGYLAISSTPARAHSVAKVEAPMRADIVDRNGELLATSVTAYSLVANPKLIWDASDVAQSLKSVFPDLKVDNLTEYLSNEAREFVYIKRGLTPRQRKAVFDLGLEGLRFEEESRRAYPRGTLAGHLLGYTNVDGKGIGGIEYAMDERLRAGGEPLRLTIDNGVQSAVESELSAAAAEHDIQGGAVIVMDAQSGEVRAMASWPPLDANRALELKTDDTARLNRATSAVYELGSVFKPFTVAAALEAGAIKPTDLFDVQTPMEIRGFEIHDLHPIHGPANATRIISESSNLGTVHINAALGPRRQKAFLELLGLMDGAPIELAGSAKPILPERFDDLSAATVSYGHGIAVTPMAFLSGFSAFANGGERARPTLVVDDGRKPVAVRVMSALTADMVNVMMREAVVSGTGKRADVAGYGVAGKTGTAEKPVLGGYDDTRNVTSFAAIFPYDRPQYALIVTLDEPKAGAERGDTAALNAAPTAGRIIERVAPLLGLAPRFEGVRPAGAELRSESDERSSL